MAATVELAKAEGRLFLRDPIGVFFGLVFRGEQARVILALNSFGVAALIWLDVLQPWHIALSSMLDGMAFSILSP